MKSTQEITQEVRELGQWIPPLRQQVAHVVVGQKYLVDRLLLGLLANGHLLLEGVPGLAKTLTVKTMASAIQTVFQRLQFRPDLFQFDFGRRNQSRASEGPECAAGSNAGAAGDHRRTDISPARSVPRSCDTEPNRTGGHVPTAGGATGSFHVQVEHWLSAKT